MGARHIAIHPMNPAPNLFGCESITAVFWVYLDVHGSGEDCSDDDKAGDEAGETREHEHAEMDARIGVAVGERGLHGFTFFAGMVATSMILVSTLTIL